MSTYSLIPNILFSTFDANFIPTRPNFLNVPLLRLPVIIIIPSLEYYVIQKP